MTTARADIPLVTIFALGGTIASTNSSDGDGGVTPQLGAAELIAAVPKLDEAAHLKTESFRQVPSGDLNLADVVALATAIEKERVQGVSGTVVTQGTDTIEETSFALDLLLPSGAPVVVTGAMRNPTLAGADGPANLLAAVQVAASPAAVGHGVLVVVNDEIHAARFIRKTHTSSPSTFQSLTAGPIGWVIEGHVHVALAPTWPTPTLPLPQGVGLPAVGLIKMYIGCDSRFVDNVEGSGYEGLIVEGFGGGHVPGYLVPALERLATRMPIVLASRTGSGELLQQTYGYSGSERDLLARDLIPPGVLDGLKARIFLTFLIAAECNSPTIREAFANFSGRQLR